MSEVNVQLKLLKLYITATMRYLARLLLTLLLAVPAISVEFVLRFSRIKAIRRDRTDRRSTESRRLAESPGSGRQTKLSSFKLRTPLTGLLPGQRVAACLQSSGQISTIIQQQIYRDRPASHLSNDRCAQKDSSLAPETQTCSRLTSDRLRSQKRSSASPWTSEP
jgi:hypothetical protein